MEVWLEILLLIVCGYGLYYLSQGAIFLPTQKDAVKTIVSLVATHGGARVVDLGSGDGRIVIALARAGAKIDGFEINWLLAFLSQIKIRRLGLQDQARIIHQNFWSADLSDYDVVVVFGITNIMARLEKKLQSELKPGTLIISNVFQFPGLAPAGHEQGIYWYRK
jgi:cyclopropane fatty-acyl-phospholipid synthase-like methyltransferase